MQKVEGDFYLFRRCRPLWRAREVDGDLQVDPIGPRIMMCRSDKAIKGHNIRLNSGDGTRRKTAVEYIPKGRPAS
jgi:hypothetical protein